MGEEIFFIQLLFLNDMRNHFLENIFKVLIFHQTNTLIYECICIGILWYDFRSMPLMHLKGPSQVAGEIFSN